MKYIRTNDGDREIIYELQNNGEWTRKGNLCLTLSHPRYEELQKCIVKQAGTIEELCDEFVIEHNGHCISDLYTIKRLLVKNKVVVYGAIWTYKGLIYIAKMNDKGELELL